MTLLTKINIPIRLNWLIFIVVVIFNGCSLVQDHLTKPQLYRVFPPKIPDLWLKQSKLHLKSWQWHILYLDEDWLQKLSWQTKKHNSMSINLQLKPKESALILVTPIFTEIPLEYSQLWQAAGTTILWQNTWVHNRPTNITSTWLSGYKTKVLWNLVQHGFDIRYFNIEKLHYYLQKRLILQTKDFYPNPYNYDFTYLVQQISSLSMQWYDIKQLKQHAISSLPSQIWQELSVAKPSVDCKTTCNPNLSEGVHYFWQGQTQKLLQVEILANGTALQWYLQ